jgi:adenylosuccinate lyase
MQIHSSTTGGVFVAVSGNSCAGGHSFTHARRLHKFGIVHARTPTVGRTHYQPASITTVGKRACIWAQDLLIAYQQLFYFVRQLRFRGIQGATGTRDSFLTLFNGDATKVRQVNETVTQLAGFESRYVCCISVQLE